MGGGGLGLHAKYQFAHSGHLSTFGEVYGTAVRVKQACISIGEDQYYILIYCT